MKVKKRIFEIIQIGNRYDLPSKAFDLFLAATIVANILVMFLETFSELEPLFPLFHAIDTATLIVFCVEYALRIWTAEFLYPDLPRRQAVFRFLRSFDGVVELLTILPFFFLSGFIVFRMLRVVRIFHLFRINAQYDSFQVITTVLKEKKDQIISSVFIILVLMLASSLCMYSAEHEAQPEQFKNAFSGIWWSVSTLLTVGYGDIYPVTVLGRCMAIVVAFLGVGVVAIPTGIISAGFVEQYTKIKTLGSYSREADVKFVTLTVAGDGGWQGKTVAELNLPPGLILALILRGGETVVPAGGTRLKEGDRVVLGAEAFQDDVDIQLKEILIKRMHPWNGVAIRDLDISRRTIIIMIRRRGRMIIPSGSTVIRDGDAVFLYSKHPAKTGADSVAEG